MHHVPLDRSRANDRNFHDQVVELARPQARQHVHLRPALDLENADRIPLAEHVVDSGVFLRHGRQSQFTIMMLFKKIEALPDTGQHAEREHVDLEDAEVVDIVLVPFDEAAVGHCSVADGHGLGQQLVGEDEATDMLAKMPRHADHLLGQLQNPSQVRIGKVQACFAQDMLLVDLVPVPAPHGARQR